MGHNDLYMHVMCQDEDAHFEATMGTNDWELHMK
jgi:hypothetical protein